MKINIELPLNSVVFCQDGEAGESIELVIDPQDHQITHIVVLQYGAERVERLVPVELIAAIHSDRVLLSCTREEFKTLDIFCEREVIIQQHDSPMSDHRTNMYNFPVTRRVVIENKSIPQGKLSVDEETSVEASDGRVGRLDKFLVDAASRSITHLVMRSSAVLGRREVIIPVSAIERFNDRAIRLNLTKKEVKELKEYPVTA